jgi:seryl-tRNA synthetase
MCVVVLRICSLFVQRRELALLHQQVAAAKKPQTSAAAAAATTASVDSVMAAARALKDRLVQEEEAVTKLESELHTAIRAIGNVVAPDVLESRDEADNVVVRTWGNEQRVFNPALSTAPVTNLSSSVASTAAMAAPLRSTPVDFPLLHHHQLLHMIDGYDADRGTSGGYVA